MMDTRDIAGKISAVSWGLFLIWVGITFLLKLGPELGMLGVGLIILGAQAARKYFQLGLEIFWVAIGILFLVGGFSRYTGIELPRDYLFPSILIIAGLALLISMFRNKQK